MWRPKPNLSSYRVGLSFGPSLCNGRTKRALTNVLCGTVRVCRWWALVVGGAVCGETWPSTCHHRRCQRLDRDGDAIACLAVEAMVQILSHPSQCHAATAVEEESRSGSQITYRTVARAGAQPRERRRYSSSGTVRYDTIRYCTIIRCDHPAAARIQAADLRTHLNTGLPTVGASFFRAPSFSSLPPPLPAKPALPFHSTSLDAP